MLFQVSELKFKEKVMCDKNINNRQMFKSKVKNIINLCEANVVIYGVSGDIRSKN